MYEEWEDGGRGREGNDDYRRGCLSHGITVKVPMPSIFGPSRVCPASVTSDGGYVCENTTVAVDRAVPCHAIASVPFPFLRLCPNPIMSHPLTLRYSRLFC